MNNKELLNSIGDVDDKFVKEAAPRKDNKSKAWIKWLSVAASICAILAVGIVISLRSKNIDDDKGKSQGERAEIGIINEDSGTEFFYYICADDGSYSLVNDDIKRIEMEAAIARFFQLNNKEDLSLTEVKHIYAEAKEVDLGDIVEFTPAQNTFEVYLEGDGLNDDIAKGLVNTLGSYAGNYVGNKNVKLYLNGEPYLIGGEMPDYGYTLFSVIINNKEKDNTEFAYYIHVGQDDYKKIKEDKIVTSRIDVDEVVKKFLILNGLDNTSLTKVDRLADSFNIYMSGESITEDVAKGLVNTVLDYSSCREKIKFAKMFVDDKEVVIDGKRTNKGYEIFELDAEYEWEEDAAADPEEMVDISFVVKDKAGNPMNNIAYHLEFVSGEKGNYQPGQGITDSSGKFTRSVHPGAVYILYLQKKNAVIYSTFERWTSYEEYVYEEFPIRIEVDSSFTQEIIWNDDETIDIAEPENAITIDVTKYYTGSYEDVFVQLISEYGSQIQLGYLENDGKIVWSESQNGWYYLQLQWFDKTNDGKLIHSESYRIRIKDGEITVDDEWDGEMKVYE